MEEGYSSTSLIDLFHKEYEGLKVILLNTVSFFPTSGTQGVGSVVTVEWKCRNGRESLASLHSRNYLPLSLSVTSWP